MCLIGVIPGQWNSAKKNLNQIICIKQNKIIADLWLYKSLLKVKHIYHLPQIKYYLHTTQKIGSMTYAPTTNAPARNANVEAYIYPDPNPNPYPALNQKPNHTHESNSVFGEVSMPEQLSPEHMSCHQKTTIKTQYAVHILFTLSGFIRIGSYIHC